MAKCLVFIQNLFIEMGFPEICDEPTPAAGDNYTATTQLQEQRLTERNRFYVTDYFYCVEIFQDGKFIPYWVRTNDIDGATTSVEIVVECGCFRILEISGGEGAVTWHQTTGNRGEERNALTNNYIMCLKA